MPHIVTTVPWLFIPLISNSKSNCQCQTHISFLQLPS
jgi:hypothetical protein